MYASARGFPRAPCIWDLFEQPEQVVLHHPGRLKVRHYTQENGEKTMVMNVVRRATIIFTLCSMLLAICAFAESAPSFNASPLVKLGDNVKYGSYLIFKIGEGIYQLNDPGVKTGKGGAWGVDMYLICGKNKALMIDLGNNYIDGYAQDVIAPRKNAAEELRAVVYGLAGKRKLEIAVTHAHPDHDGMTSAFADKKVPIWMPEGEDINAPKTQHKVDPSVYTRFATGKQSFDLGGGRIVNTFLVRGHSNGGTVYILKKDMLLFTGDTIGSGFGQAFANIERLKYVAEDAQKLVDYITANFSPYERYALRVYTGHAWQNAYGGFMSPNHDRVDVGYLDWRFVQNVSSCANGILKGKWLVEGSGLRYVGNMEYTDSWPSAKGRAIMLYGIGTIIIPIEAAYEAAGLKMPK
jgi:glyoxylase-like metal-dependent hydrolase (beta-lactamase superfamily II)